MLEKAKSNITREANVAIKTPQNDTSIIILAADKDNATRMKDKLGFTEKLANLVRSAVAS